MEWISIEDRLPEHKQDVWYYFSITGVCQGKYDANENCFYSGRGWLCGDVTHWQPCEVPNPPEDK